MDALEIMAFDMLNNIKKGPLNIMHQSSNDGASNSELKKKCVLWYKKEEKRELNLDVKAKVAIGNSLPFLFIV